MCVHVLNVIMMLPPLLLDSGEVDRLLLLEALRYARVAQLGDLRQPEEAERPRHRRKVEIVEPEERQQFGVFLLVWFWFG